MTWVSEPLREKFGIPPEIEIFVYKSTTARFILENQRREGTETI